MTTKTRPKCYQWQDQILASNLPSQARLIAFVLVHHMNNSKTFAYPSIDRIVELTQLSRSTCIRYLKILEKKGFISVERKRKERTNCTNIYYLVLQASDGFRGALSENNGVTVTPPNGGGSVTQTLGWCQSDTRVVSHRHPNNQLNNQKNKQKETSNRRKELRDALQGKYLDKL